MFDTLGSSLLKLGVGAAAVAGLFLLIDTWLDDDGYCDDDDDENEADDLEAAKAAKVSVPDIHEAEELLAQADQIESVFPEMARDFRIKAAKIKAARAALVDDDEDDEDAVMEIVLDDERLEAWKKWKKEKALKKAKAMKAAEEESEAAEDPAEKEDEDDGAVSPSLL